MKNIFVFCSLAVCLSIASCKDCTIQPDLISDLIAPTTDIIVGEPVDWDYVVESVEDNSDDCEIVKAIASIGRIVVSFFTDESDPTSDETYNNTNGFGELSAGEMESATNNLIFSDQGIYMISVNADDTNVVEERNEMNNADTAEEDTRSSYNLFPNPSPAFLEKLEGAAAIVIVNGKSDNPVGLTYQGKPVYFARK